MAFKLCKITLLTSFAENNFLPKSGHSTHFLHFLEGNHSLL